MRWNCAFGIFIFATALYANGEVPVLETRSNLAPELILPLSQAGIFQSDLEALINESSRAAQSQDLVNQLSHRFPEVIIVIAPPLSEAELNYEPTPQNIIYRDKQISGESLILLNHFVEKGLSHGVFNPPQQYDGLAISRPVIAIRANVPKVVLVHEFLHYFIYKNWASKNPNRKSNEEEDRRALKDFVRKWGLQEADIKNSNLMDFAIGKMRGRDAEHVDITTFILRNASALKLTENEVDVSKGKWLRSYLFRPVKHLQVLSRSSSKLLGPVLSAEGMIAFKSELESFGAEISKVESEFLPLNWKNRMDD